MIKKLFIIAFLSDLLSPMLIWKAGFPAEVRWVSLIALCGILCIGFYQIIKKKSLPKIILLIFIMSILGIAQAVLNGQSLLATLWGWWLMFKYPLLGVIVAIQNNWSEKFARTIIKWGPYVIAFEVFIQIIQVLLGETRVDQIAGTLSRYQWGGTSFLVMLLLLILAFELAWWLVSKKTLPIFIVAGLGLVSSVLGEMKLFFFAASLIFIFAMAIALFRYHRFISGIIVWILMGAVLYIYPIFYNNYLFHAGQGSFYNIFQPSYYQQYLDSAQVISTTGFTVGRNLMVRSVWDQISKYPDTIIFGLGLGARQESKTLGSVGLGLKNSGFGLVTGGSLAVILGELGLLGIFVLMVFYITSISFLWKRSKKSTDPYIQSLFYGLLIFSILWPVWLWYSTAWTLDIPISLYWVIFGYILQKPEHKLTAS